MADDNSYAGGHLIEAIAEGDTEAFRNFFVQYSPAVQRWIKQFVRNDDAILEVLQDIFIDIWLYRDKLPAVNNMMPWLKTVTSHQCFKYLKRQKLLMARTENYTASLSDTDYAVAEHQLSYKEMQGIVQQVLSSLTPQQRKIFQLSREHDLNSTTIATKLGLSRGHVRNTISDILENIRQKLKHYNSDN